MSDRRSQKLEINDKPLVTFALFTYNQEKYIRQAVEAAMAQEYDPIEIIISDDCSDDNTFKIIKEISNKYQGLKTLIINRNEINIGISNHVNKILEISNGDFIVMAAGDDISTPDRTDILISEWERLGKTACSIFTNATVINGKGEISDQYYVNPQFSKNIDEFIESKNCWLGGFSHGFSRELYDQYGPITDKTFQEDGVFAFRALLNRGVFYIPKITVLYRRHGQNSYDPHAYKKLKKLYKSEIGLTYGQLADLDKHNKLTTQKKREIEIILTKKIKKIKIIMTIPGLFPMRFFAQLIKNQILSKLRTLL